MAGADDNRDESQVLQSQIVAMRDPIPSFLTFLLSSHDLVVLRFFIAGIDTPWLSKTLIAGIGAWPCNLARGAGLAITQRSVSDI